MLELTDPYQFVLDNIDSISTLSMQFIKSSSPQSSFEFDFPDIVSFIYFSFKVNSVKTEMQRNWNGFFDFLFIKIDEREKTNEEGK